MKMQKVAATAIVLCLLGAGWISADLISSSITTDGTAWVSSALVGEKTYAATLFTSDRSAIVRELDFAGDIRSQTLVNGSGPAMVHEFSARKAVSRAPGLVCVFADHAGNTTRHDEISTLGLWSSGTYRSSRSITDGQTGSLTGIDATGMVSLGKGTDHGNTSQRERSFVAGTMNITEAVIFGEES